MPVGKLTTQDPVYIVAGLPEATAGRRGFVSDALQTLADGLGATVAGGGEHFVPVYADGENWKIG